MVVELPLLFFNGGPMPIVVENLRLLFSDEADARPLDFIATVEKIGTNQSRAFATQFPVRGRESVLYICEFQRQPGGLVFETKGYPVQLQAMLNGSDKWKTILDFSLNVSQIDLSTINRSLVVHDNMTGG